MTADGAFGKLPDTGIAISGLINAGYPAGFIPGAPGSKTVSPVTGIAGGKNREVSSPARRSFSGDLQDGVLP